MARLDEASERSVERVRVGEDGDRDRRRGIAVLCVIVAVAVGFGIWALTSGSGVELERSSDEEVSEPSDPAPEAEDGESVGEDDVEADATGEVLAASPEPEPAPTVAKVHVDGAVLVPGVYEVYGDDPRVADAVAAAGGLAEEADTSAVNLAAQVHDADKVHIPRVEEAATPVASAGEVPAGSSTTASAATTPSEAGTGAPASGPININTATAEELTALPGVGEKTAEKIVADREAQGPFASVEDLMRVSGIGEKKFAQVRDLICV